MDGDAAGADADGFLEDFLGLQVAPIGEVDIGFCHRVDIAGGIKLARRIHHGRAGDAGFIGVDALAAAGAKEGVGLQTAFQEGAVYHNGIFVATGPVDTQGSQKRQQTGAPRE